MRTVSLALLPALFLATAVACGGSESPSAASDEATPASTEAHDDEAHEEGHDGEVHEEGHDGEAHEEGHDDDDGKAEAGAHEGHGDDQAVGAFVGLPGDAKVFFTSPEDGATVESPVTVTFGVEGATVKPAGPLEEGTGHHHVILGAEGIAQGHGVPKDDKHIHYGGGQTEGSLELPPGEHTLTLQFADGAHRSYGPALTSSITITVEE